MTVDPPTQNPQSAPRRCAPVAVVGGAALLLALLITLVASEFTATQCGSEETICKSNLMNIGTACEMYSTDNNGLYPHNLDALVPNYLKSLPTCPRVGVCTYKAGYTWSAHPDAYTVVCSGTNHSGVSDNANYPQYTSTQGLLEK